MYSANYTFIQSDHMMNLPARYGLYIKFLIDSIERDLCNATKLIIKDKLYGETSGSEPSFLGLKDASHGFSFSFKWMMGL